MSAEWSNGLCGCFNNLGLCVISYFVPCYTHGKNAEAVGEDCLLCGLSLLLPIAGCFFGAKIREKIREQKGIAGGFGNDLLMHFCCPFCAIVQEAQEVDTQVPSTIGQAAPAQAMARQ